MCHPLESVFSALKQREITLSPDLFGLFHKAADTIAQLVASAGAERSEKDSLSDRELINMLVSVSHGTAINDRNFDIGPSPLRQTTGGSSKSSPSRAEEARRAGEGDKSVKSNLIESVITLEPLPAQPDAVPLPSTINSVRIPVSRLDPLLAAAEEMLQIKMIVSQRIYELKEIKQTLNLFKKEPVRPQENIETFLNILQNQVSAVIAAFIRDRRVIERMVDDQLETMKQVLMLPVASLLEAFPKFVRDLANDQGKEAELIIHGADIEIDKRILDELKDPLMHIIRNCIDHGIKKSDERVRLNKPAMGTITITFTPKEGRQVEILITDDGVGIDAQQVLASAVKSGIITEAQAHELSFKDTLALVFQSGVSTSPMLTEISGRGLGLAIVREKIDRLGGSISLETSPGAGTAFRFLLPLSLSTFRGVVAKVDEQLFVFPLDSIKRVTRVKNEEIKTVENRETILVDGQVLSAVRLGKALSCQGGRVVPQIPPRNNAGVSGKYQVTGYVPVIILSSEDKDIAFMVDEVLEEQQYLVKSLGRQLNSVRNISGAALLGNGRIVLIINVKDLMKSAVEVVETGSVAPVVKGSALKNKKILVAEDSITSRTLLKNILETAGYQVVTAVDGADAFAQVRTGEFDLVVSDVDMPRMNGFELTAGIRAEKKLSELPVVLVTALDSREDRERGIDAGANAYIVKNSFDQSNLLEAIKKLI
jgi:two-component system chemotaxis sensor kinase CheA